jgi:hypothetical protein
MVNPIFPRAELRGQLAFPPKNFSYMLIGEVGDVLNF